MVFYAVLWVIAALNLVCSSLICDKLIVHLCERLKEKQSVKQKV